MRVICVFILLVPACVSNPHTRSVTNPGLDSLFKKIAFDTTFHYQDSTTLQYKGRSLLLIGQNIKQLDTTLSYRYDPNGQFQGYWPEIVDYLSLDDFYSDYTGSRDITGAIYFSADKKGRIFRLSGNWTVRGDSKAGSGLSAMDYVCRNYFPSLPPDIRQKRWHELKHKYFTEFFRIYSLPDSTQSANSFKYNWNLDYQIQLNKEGHQ